jgi:non-specific serine/threonine protein kinase
MTSPELLSADDAAAHVPVHLTRFVGRGRELEDLAQLVYSARLLTLTGAGGSGKTRLAYEVAREVSDEFPGGVLALPLAPIADPALVSLAIAQAFGLRHAGAEPLVDALRRHVRQSIVQPTLVVLDNFEHVLPAAPLLADLLDASPRLTCLVTSRASLRIYGEEEYPIAPLPVPDATAPPPELRRSAAVRLFAQRARASTPAFRLTDENVAAVAAICRKLDGLPLALELAAARVKLFPLKALLDRLDRSLEFLTDGPRPADAPPYAPEHH